MHHILSQHSTGLASILAESRLRCQISAVYIPLHEATCKHNMCTGVNCQSHSWQLSHRLVRSKVNDWVFGTLCCHNQWTTNTQKSRHLSAMEVQLQVESLALRWPNLVVASTANVSTDWLNSCTGVTGCDLNDLLLSVDDLKMQEKMSDQKAQHCKR